jgi:predicted GIY-YIG superfamily endonuclease
MSGTVYLLHLEPGLPVTANRVARHYLGFTDHDARRRLAEHLQGRGSPLVAAVAARGRVTLERTWAGVDRTFERRLKHRHEAPRLCPRCLAAGLTNRRGPLSPAVTG